MSWNFTNVWVLILDQIDTTHTVFQHTEGYDTLEIFLSKVTSEKKFQVCHENFPTFASKRNFRD